MKKDLTSYSGGKWKQLKKQLEKSSFRNKLQVIASLRSKTQEAGAKPAASEEYVFGSMQFDGMKMIVEDEGWEKFVWKGWRGCRHL